MLAIVFLHPVVLGGRALLPAEYLAAMRPWGAVLLAQDLPQWNPLLWDGIAQFYPWRVHYGRSVTSGFVPLWNPHQFCGTPFAANAQTAVFYPLNLIFAAFDPRLAFGLAAALHLFLAGVFTFILARALGLGRFGALVAGITFAYSAFMVLWLELPTFANVAAWLPLALYCILRSSDAGNWVWAVLSGLVLGLAILAGHFQVASYVLLAAALWWVWLIVPRVKGGAVALRIGLFAISLGVAFLIAAPQVLMTFELAGLSHRVREATSEGYAKYVANAIPPRSLITLFLPNFYGNPSTNSYWTGSAADYMEFGIYAGILPLVLAIVGTVFAIRWKRVGYFVLLAVLAILLALGTPINAIFYYLVPGTSALGGPNRVAVLFCFSIAMLAGFGAQWFLQRAQDDYPATGRKLGWRALAVGSAVFAMVFIVAQVVAATTLSALGVDVGQIAALSLGQYLSFGVLLVAGLAILGLFTAGYIPRPLFAGLAIAAIVGDLFSFGMVFNPTVPRDQVYPETPLIRWLRREAARDRLMPINRTWSLVETPDAVLPPNAATVHGLYDVQGYDSLFPRRYKEFVDKTLGRDSSPPENGNILFIRDYVENWPRGTAGCVLSAEPLHARGLQPAIELDGVHVYRLVGRGPHEKAYILGDGGRPVGRAWVVREKPNSVTVMADTDQVSRLVLASTYYPGWRAYLDGTPRPVSVAQDVFQSVEIDPGTQSVSFRFEPGTFIVGAFLGLLGATAVGMALGAAMARGRTHGV